MIHIISSPHIQRARRPFCQHLLLADQRARFEGTVTDQESQPVDGIRVVVSGLVSGMANLPEIAPETDLAGSYSFASITLQTAEVEIEVAVHGSRVGLEV